MARKNKKINRLFKSRRALLATGAVLVIAAGGIAWAVNNHNQAADQSNSGQSIGQSGNSSGQKSGQTKTSTSSSKASPGSANQGEATDLHGKAPAASAKSSQWVTSASGNITVEQPVKNASFKTGNYLIGKAKLGRVQYRLTDNSIGVIAQGSLSVSSGKFSGILTFSNSASTGELDVFSYSASGAEINEVQIPISF